jgi:dCTP deaminase
MIHAREQIGPSSVNVHLGTDFSVVEQTNRDHFDPLMSLEEYEEWLKHARLVGRYSVLDPFILHPFEFALACTLEFISLGRRIVGHIDGRSSWARQGLRVHSTAANIHPGSSGFVVFEFNNVGPVPILLYPGMAIAQLTFEELSVPVSEKYCDRANSQYSGFRQTLWSGYPQDSILQAMREARDRETKRLAVMGTRIERAQKEQYGFTTVNRFLTSGPAYDELELQALADELRAARVPAHAARVQASPDRAASGEGNEGQQHALPWQTGAASRSAGPALGPLSRLEDLQTEDEAKTLLEKIQAALPHLPRAAVVVGEEGAYLLEWTVGRRRVGISIEKNPSESGWYHVSLDPAAPGSGSGSMKELDILQLFARLSG